MTLFLFPTINMPSKIHVAVIGAGSFGGWTALYLLRRKARVTLIDAWGPGNSRSSSGGESRIMRGTYGPNQPYTKMAAHALRLWREHETRWGLQFLHRTGVLWMVTSTDDQFERSSLPMLREAGIAYEELSGMELGKRWPQINVEDVRWAIYEPEGGFLSARFACQAIAEQFVKAGGQYKQVAVLPHDLENGVRDGVTLSDDSKLTADHYVFACGPWLGKLFPRPLATSFAPRSKMYFSLARLQGTIVFRRQACQSGQIIAIVSFTVFQLQMDGDSKSPTTLAAQSSIPLQVNAL